MYIRRLKKAPKAYIYKKTSEDSELQTTTREHLLKKVFTKSTKPK